MTVGEASEELKCMDRGDRGEAASVGYFSTQSVDVVYHT